MRFNFDVIVVGAGHAGCEAATASANLGSKTLLITMDMNKVGQMSCNPAVGGIAKGQIVREIDALGGNMGIITDKSAIQFRMLNRSKGPAMWSPRAQSDRHRFMEEWRKTLDQTPNLSIWQDCVTSLLFKDGILSGVLTSIGVTFYAKSVVLTTGTFMNGLMHIGKTQFAGGRISEPASYGITEQLREMGFTVGRMKTGTPVRIDGRSIRFDLTIPQEGEDDFHQFSYLPTPFRQLKQRSCYMTYTNEQVHEILRKGLSESPLYNGQIQSIGPRYCPSIETKIVTFADKIAHQLFIEPEGEDTQEYYLNGFSSSLPWQIQIAALKKVPAFENIQIYRPGYAIEYDYFDPTQLKHTLETKQIENLFFAGQINGTTGYEEAAGQGLIAGVNAHQKSHGGTPFVLKRDQAYIGVLIDDLVTKGVDEPYRMFTSRAEYRILLRQDNADVRLTPLSYTLGLAKRERVDLLQERLKIEDKLVSFLEEHSVKPDQMNALLEQMESAPLKQGTKIVDLLRRPQLTIQTLASVDTELNSIVSEISHRRDEIVESAEIRVKYQGYIDREKGIAEKIERLESIILKGKFDYSKIKALSTEARQKLERIDPETIGQASRIPGISPSDINILLVLLGR